MGSLPKLEHSPVSTQILAKSAGDRVVVVVGAGVVVVVVVVKSRDLALSLLDDLPLGMRLVLQYSGLWMHRSMVAKRWALTSRCGALVVEGVVGRGVVVL